MIRFRGKKFIDPRKDARKRRSEEDPIGSHARNHRPEGDENDVDEGRNGKQRGKIHVIRIVRVHTWNIIRKKNSDKQKRE